MSENTPISPDDDARDMGRTDAFSDGVIAIAITLLAFQLRVPDFEQSAAANGLLLMGFTVLPFTTELISTYLRAPDQQDVVVAALIYTGWLLVIVLLFNAIWRYASSGRACCAPASPTSRRSKSAGSTASARRFISWRSSSPCSAPF